MDSQLPAEESLVGEAPPLVILIVIDTLRRDYLGVYGAAQDLTPNIDRLAQESFVFDQAIAPSSWTRSTVASLFTGRYASAIGVLEREDALADQHETVAEIFAKAGWRTAALSANANAGRRFGFAQGFESFKRARILRSYPGDKQMIVAEGITQEALTIIERHQSAGTWPLFLFLHFVDPHDPYLPHSDPALEATQNGRFSGSRADLGKMDKLSEREITAADQDQIRGLYAGEVRYCDQWVGRFLDDLRKRGLFEQSLIVVTADHGEGLWDHGIRQHGQDLYNEQIHVPLILHLPSMTEGDGRRVDVPVSLVDVAPTILSVCGLQPPADSHGFDLTRLMTGKSTGAKRAIYSEITLDRANFESIQIGRYKLVRRRGLLGFFIRDQLFDLAADPAERNNLARRWKKQQIQIELDARLDEISRSMSSITPISSRVTQEQLDTETLEALEALGYIN